MYSKTRINKMITEINELKEIAQENKVKIKTLEAENVSLKDKINKLSEAK